METRLDNAIDDAGLTRHLMPQDHQAAWAVLLVTNPERFRADLREHVEAFNDDIHEYAHRWVRGDSS